MIRLTLRTLLAYIDDTLEPDEARVLGKKVAESEEAQKIIERIKQATRRRGLGAPVAAGNDEDGSNPNVVAEYLSDNLSPEQVGELEEKCLDSDLHLAEVAACHQILTVILTDPVRVPPTANQRMYKLVGAPASDPNRKPGKTTPIGGVLPTAEEPHDADDPDAALLLGMKRYAESESWAGRIGLVTAVAVVAATLAVAVYFSLPHGTVQSPETSPVAMGPPVPFPAVTPKGTAIAPDPKVVDPKKVETPDPKKVETPDPKKVETPDPKKVETPDPKVGGPKPEDLAALPGNEDVGKIESTNVIMLTRAPEATAKWFRVEPTGRSAIRANDQVVALPGYKGDVRLTSGVVVHLWGNVPDQVLLKPPVFESRVRFHPAAGGLDADLSLDAGRIYITTTKPGGAKLRLRVGSEVWDVQLRDEKTEILVQSNTWFVPGGTQYARTGGEKPKVEARLVTLRGAIDFQAPTRFKKFDALAPWNEITWDSKSAQLSEPHPAPKDELQTSRYPAIEGEAGKLVQRVLSEAQKSLTNPEGIRVLLKERINADPTMDKPRPGLFPTDVYFMTQSAIFSQAAIMDGPDAGDLLKDFFDVLRNESRPYARQAAILALSNWIARSPENTEVLVKGMIEKGWEPEPSDTFARLIRGWSTSDTKDRTAAIVGLDRLVELLEDGHPVIREAALANLLSNYGIPDTFTPANRILTSTDVATRAGGMAKQWEAFLKAWKDHASAIKAKMAEKK
ncbi:MAG: hypothetical protein K8U57_19760 [Planctomycetes bacterium]|nr:hypothetical protein [Planctomycetota bacterium]